MDFKEKNEILNYYCGTQCKCGNTKREWRWICKECKTFSDSKEEQILSDVCGCHLDLGRKFAEDCLKRKKS